MPVNPNEIKLEQLFGKTMETRIFDLILPLKDGTVFTNKQVIKALGAKEAKINAVLKGMVDNELILSAESIPGKHMVNERSKRVWALKNLLVSMYVDKAHYNAIKKLGIKEKKEKPGKKKS